MATPVATPVALHHTSQTMIDIDNKISNRYRAPYYVPRGWGPYGDPYYWNRGYMYGPSFSAPLYVPGSTAVIPTVYAPAFTTSKPTAAPTASPTVAPTMVPVNTVVPVTPVPAIATRKPAPKNDGGGMWSAALVVCCCCAVVAAYVMSQKR